MSQNPVIKAISDFANEVYAHAMPFLVACAAIGVITMAVIQTVKDLLPVQRWFHRWFIGRWIERQLREAGQSTSETPTVEHFLTRLATGGDANAFYDLPIEQLCGQINAAVQLILDYPWKYEPLLQTLAAQAERKDVDLLLKQPPGMRENPAAFREGNSELVSELVDARSRVTHHVQRAIDGLQISSGFRWKLYLQIASFVLSFGITLLALLVGDLPLPGAIAVSLAGGFLAPVARDLMAALQRLRA